MIFNLNNLALLLACNREGSKKFDSNVEYWSDLRVTRTFFYWKDMLEETKTISSKIKWHLSAMKLWLKSKTSVLKKFQKIFRKKTKHLLTQKIWNLFRSKNFRVAADNLILIIVLSLLRLSLIDSWKFSIGLAYSLTSGSWKVTLYKSGSWRVIWAYIAVIIDTSKLNLKQKLLFDISAYSWSSLAFRMVVATIF